MGLGVGWGGGLFVFLMKNTRVIALLIIRDGVFVEAVCSEESARTRILNWASESEILYKIVFACASVFFLERIPKFLQTVKGVYDFPGSKCVESL